MVKDIEKLLVMLRKIGTVRGRTRFQKMIFLLKEKENIDLGYNFIPYYYGPYAQDLQLELDMLEAAGFIQVKHQDGNLYVHSLTEQGKDIANEIANNMEKGDLLKLEKSLRKYKSKSTVSLIKEAKKIAGMTS
jgi:uncharacterized protein YwgA